MRLLLAALLLVPSVAFAEQTSTTDVRKMATDDCARARKLKRACVLDAIKAKPFGWP